MIKLLFWLCYLFLLGVLLPHTSWTFSQMEPPEARGLGVAAALAFEISLALLTHFLAIQIARVQQVGWRAVKDELLSVPAILLGIVLVISVVANWTHANEFVVDSTARVFQNGAIQTVYPFLFGAALPICSFAFAYVLSSIYRRDAPQGTRKGLSDFPNGNGPESYEDKLDKIIKLCLQEGRLLPPKELGERLDVPIENIEQLYLDAKKRMVAIFK